MSFFRRFLAIAAIVASVDFALVLAGSLTTSLPLWIVDSGAILCAALLSFVLHRALSFAAEPARRWYRGTRHYVIAAAVAGAFDVGLFSLVMMNRDRVAQEILLAKTLGFSAAVIVRLGLYRRVMMSHVRSDQQRPSRGEPAEGSLRLSLVIPAYFEEERIAETIHSVERALGFLRSEGGFEIIVVDDGSTDATSEQARAAGADVVLTQPQNLGKGAAVRAGTLAARGRSIAFTDADLSYEPTQVLALLEGLEQGWDAVVGSRKHTATTTVVAAGRLREVGGRIINGFTSVVLLGQYRDTQCGLKGFRSEVARVLFGKSKVNGFAFDIELFHLIERYRCSLLEVPVQVTNSEQSTVHVARDGLALVRDLFRIRRNAHLGEYELTTEEKTTLGFSVEPSPANVARR